MTQGHWITKEGKRIFISEGRGHYDKANKPQRRGKGGLSDRHRKLLRQWVGG
jgi:hypothetical protein